MPYIFGLSHLTAHWHQPACRGSLAGVLVEACKKFSNSNSGTPSSSSGSVGVQFGCTVKDVDFERKVLSLQQQDGSEVSVPFDLLVGADGTFSQ